VPTSSNLAYRKFSSCRFISLLTATALRSSLCLVRLGSGKKQVAQGRIPQTIGVRFSLDETFDVGEDTGTPVLEEYADKMPFRFTGTLTKFVAVLEPLKLSDDEQRRLREELAKAMMTVQ